MKFIPTIMKSYKSILVFFLISTLLSGWNAGCSSTREKKLRTKDFTLMYKNKTAAGYEVAKTKIRGVQLSEEIVHQQMRSLVFEELNLFGKKKPVFTREEVDHIARLITKALNRSTPNKIVYYELESKRGTTAGIVFASGKVLNWQFSSIQGGNFSSRSFTGWGGTKWRLVPGSGQYYHVVEKALGSVAQENWIKATLPKNSARQSNHTQMDREPAPSRSKRKPSRAEPAPKRKQAPSLATNPDLEKKLQFLKDLYEKNLVDKEEYNRKRKELLDTYL